MKKFLCLFLASCLLLAVLTACAEETASNQDQPSSVAGTDTEDSASSGTETDQSFQDSESEAEENLEPPLSEADMTAAVPDFLTPEQQLLYRHARAAASFLMGCNTAQVDLGFPLPDGSTPVFDGSQETVELDGWTYLVSVGRYSQWDDFQAMLDGLFTEEYQQELLSSALSDGTNLPIFREMEDGRMCYIDASRGSDIRYGDDSGDTFELVSQDEDKIVFHLIGHYASLAEDGSLDFANPTTTAYTIQMERTADGWRFSEFHVPY